MTNPFQNFDWSAKSIGKIIGIFLLGIVGLSIAISLVGFAFDTVFNRNGYNNDYDYAGGAPEAAMMKSDAYTSEGIMPPEPQPGGVDAQAEDYEVQSYNLNYAPRSKTKICDAVLALKADKEIIFENSNESDRSCNYSFKVIKERTEEILTLLKELKPKDIDSNTYTIQKAVEGLTDNLTIQKNKLAETEKTLAEAQSSYSELSNLATKKQDIESLTKLIDLKLNTIDRLSKERIAINEEISRLTKARAEQLEQLKYTNFNVSVYADPFVDWQEIVDSWKSQIQQFVQDFNNILQDLSIGLIKFTLQAIMGMVYFTLALILLKVVWLIAKRIWRFRQES